MNDVAHPEQQRHLALTAALARLAADPDFVDLSTIPGAVIDLRYASTDNFTGVDLYGAFNRAFLRRSAALQLRRACRLIGRRCRGCRLAILDAARPRSVQQRLWAQVAGTPQECHVAAPAAGSIHNFGFAVDVTLIDARSRELDMGSAYDSFDELSQPRLEQQHLRSGRLSAAQLENRLLLRDAMQAAGFLQHPLEWWHFDALEQTAARTYPIIE